MCGSWNQEQLTRTCVKSASKTFGIPRSTLQDHVSGKVTRSKLGPREAIFRPDQEAKLLQHLLDFESRLYGITMIDVRKLAFELAEENEISRPFYT